MSLTQKVRLSQASRLLKTKKVFSEVGPSHPALGGTLTRATGGLPIHICTSGCPGNYSSEDFHYRTTSLGCNSATSRSMKKKLPLECFADCDATKIKNWAIALLQSYYCATGGTGRTGPIHDQHKQGPIQDGLVWHCKHY